MPQILSCFAALSILVTSAVAILNATEDAFQLVISNDRLYAMVNKSTGAVATLNLDGQDLLGDKNYIPNTPGGSSGNGQYGIGPYLDCYCIPSGTWTP
jgi:rhamnogalacturonan endolyase